jgi:hypothetical protein
MGGLLAAIALNAASVFRVRVGYEDETLAAHLSLRLRGTYLNILCLGLGGLLLAAIAVYLFLENFQPR